METVTLRFKDGEKILIALPVKNGPNFRYWTELLAYKRAKVSATNFKKYCRKTKEKK